MDVVGARRRVRWEIALVLLLSLLPSALYAALSLLELVMAPAPIAQTQLALNPQLADTAVFDTANRFVSFLAGVAPVGLVVWLLWTRRESGLHRLGLSWRGFGDIGRGMLLAAVIGIPGLGLYAVSRLAGFTVQVVAGDSSFRWDTVLALVLAAVRAALVEEVVVVAYLALRLRALGWHPAAIIASSALLRGSYHLYQGVAMAFGNVVMGVVFASAFLVFLRPRTKVPGEAQAVPRRSRVLPLVIAHFILDAISFLGYPLALALFPQIF